MRVGSLGWPLCSPKKVLLLCAATVAALEHVVPRHRVLPGVEAEVVAADRAHLRHARVVA